MVILNEEMKVQLSNRLCSERKRLGFEQVDLQDELGIALATISRYENAKRLPDLGIAKQLSDLGYDMAYVITGRRLGEQSSDLTDEEMQWLELYRSSQRGAELVRLVKTYETMV